MGKPGVKWSYCGGAKGTGEALLPYARRALFDPLGFDPTEWTKGKDSEPHTASGLRLLPRDMLKVGQLVLAGGTWNGSQIVPADWVKRVSQRRQRICREPPSACVAPSVSLSLLSRWWSTCAIVETASVGQACHGPATRIFRRKPSA